MNIKLYFDEYFVGRENKFYMFIRPNVSYAFDKCNLSVEATAYNMMNYNYLSEYGISDYYSEEALYSVIPAQYLLNIQLRF